MRELKISIKKKKVREGEGEKYSNIHRWVYVRLGIFVDMYIIRYTLHTLPLELRSKKVLRFSIPPIHGRMINVFFPKGIFFQYRFVRNRLIKLFFLLSITFPTSIFSTLISSPLSTILLFIQLR